MRTEMSAGDILIKEGAVLPEALAIESAAYAPGWRLVKGVAASALDEKVHDVGWNFFCLAGEIEAIAFGNDEQSLTRRAVKRILADPRLAPFNSVEITQMTMRRFLGLPYMSVAAQSRHIQKSFALFSDEAIPESGEGESTATAIAVRDLKSVKELGPGATNRPANVAAVQSL
jgi:hypothetical protein